MSIHDILNEFREAARNKRDMGDRFERLFANYLVTEPFYRDRFSDVWMWTEWPERGKRPDTGIDLVARERDSGDYCAIQCKFYAPEHRIEKADLDSFFATSAKAPFTSRIVVSTTDNWSSNAEHLLVDIRIPCIRLRLQDLVDSAIDWSQFTLSRPDKMKLRAKKTVRLHQQEAIDDVMNGLKDADRGKLIMACGTGKTFTALKVAEKFAEDAKPKTAGAKILFLVPSIALLGQALKEWSEQSRMPMHALAVCSDVAVGKLSDTEDIRIHDLPFPATTNPRTLGKQLGLLKNKRPLTVIFSTYQSLATIHEAQRLHNAPTFDLIICDEAHRTTGITLSTDDESSFVKVHDAKYIVAKKRLYMTATPRIYMDSAKSKAKEADAELCSMDDEALYGRELHRLGFGEAIGKELLADYKVMVLAVDEKFVSKTFQTELAAAGNAKGKGYDDYFSDLVKITGCWNGLSKRMISGGDTQLLAADLAPMHRAVAFANTIAASKRIKELFAGIVEKYIEQAPEEQRDTLLRCEVDHVDGTMNALKRANLLDWLKTDTDRDGSICRILSNARCLTEGVDVPALDAILFLNPRNSVVDVVQAVGRVMRRVEGKKYGYIILPIGIPADTEPEIALKDNEKYKIVWQVLQALRSHDERIEAEINKIDLTGKKPANIDVIGVGGGPADESGNGLSAARPIQVSLDFPNLDQWRDAIFAKIVLKCGDRRYWESWAKDVAQIAEHQITRIKALLEAADKKPKHEFDLFLAGLRNNLNPSVTEDDAIEMLAQHLITQPVFDALFEGYSFTQHNPVSLSMQKMLDVLYKNGLGKEPEALEKFYASVRLRASGIDNAEARQRIIVELYDKFFRTAFPRMAARLGIVYTPIEIVDFILGSADYMLRKEFGVGLSDQGVHVLDPFTGTGTFIVRLLQGGLVKTEDLVRKYHGELHANELVLLAYYIAAVNIEYAYHLQRLKDKQDVVYEPFEGIVLTDTFQLSETKGSLEEKMFPDNNKRVNQQKAADIRVIVGNPPYSVGQTSEADNNKNLKYADLDDHIRRTYAAQSDAGLLRNLYDPYIRAIRWASDRIKDKGIICYVTNGRFIDAGFANGLRRHLAKEFKSVYVFNLRGFVKGRLGDDAKREGGNVFNILTGVAITILVKDSDHRGDGDIYYHDIGDYLTRDEKLQLLRVTANAKGVPWRKVTPDEHGDWINIRDPAFAEFMVLGDKENSKTLRVFNMYSQGVLTSRDAWAYNFSQQKLISNMDRMVSFYNDQRIEYGKLLKRTKGEPPAVDEIIDLDTKKISWSRSLKGDVRKQKLHKFNRDNVTTSLYRPYTKQHLYLDRRFNEMVYQIPKLFPRPDLKNTVIVTTAVGARREFSALITDCIPNYHTQDTGLCFPLYYYEELPQDDLLAKLGETGLVRRDSMSDTALLVYRKAYKGERHEDGKTGADISKEDLFYYVYGILHSPEYKARFEIDLKKQLPRIPLARDFWAFSQAGRQLASWHLDYETVEPFPLQQVGELDLGDPALYRVQKMIYAKKRVEGKIVEDKSTLIYNSRITLTGIPPEALEYIVNGKPALEWVMERYQVTTDKDSGIVNDPNEWATEHGDPAYILDLLKRIVRVSVETVKIVKGLPALQER